MKMYNLVVNTVLVLLFAFAAFAQDFAEPIILVEDVLPLALGVEDFNDDGRLDFVYIKSIENSDERHLYIHLWQGEGEYESIRIASFERTYFISITTCKLADDGYTQIIALAQDSKVYIFNIDQDLSSETIIIDYSYLIYFTGLNSSFTITDLDRNGLMDIVLTTTTIAGGILVVFMQTDEMEFTPQLLNPYAHISPNFPADAYPIAKVYAVENEDETYLIAELDLFLDRNNAGRRACITKIRYDDTFIFESIFVSEAEYLENSILPLNLDFNEAKYMLYPMTLVIPYFLMEYSLFGKDYLLVSKNQDFQYDVLVIENVPHGVCFFLYDNFVDSTEKSLLSIGYGDYMGGSTEEENPLFVRWDLNEEGNFEFVDLEQTHRNIYSVETKDITGNGYADLVCLAFNSNTYKTDLLLFENRAPNFIPNHSKQTLPNEFDLSALYPNPFNGNVSIEFNISKTDLTSIEIFDVQGRLIRSLYNGVLEIGAHKMNLDLSDLSNGVYLLNLSNSKSASVLRLNLLK